TQRSKSFEAGSERLQPCGVGPVVIGQQNVRHRQSVVSRITHVVHLKLGPSSRGKEEVVGTTGFEPATSRTPSVRATRLRYVPTAGNTSRNRTVTKMPPRASGFSGLPGRVKIAPRPHVKAITAVREASRKRAACRACPAASC